MNTIIIGMTLFFIINWKTCFVVIFAWVCKAYVEHFYLFSLTFSLYGTILELLCEGTANIDQSDPNVIRWKK